MSTKVENEVYSAVSKLITAYANFEVYRAILPVIFSSKKHTVLSFTTEDRDRVHALIDDACESHMDAVAWGRGPKGSAQAARTKADQAIARLVEEILQAGKRARAEAKK